MNFDELRLIAMYLPQFHRVKENDEWWGEGFTEWTAVKAAKPLFEGHEQPREPLHDKYYDLLEKDVMKWQAALMHQYGIDGVCIYHYWFKDGRRILEKPAENLLAWEDIEMPYCFCWANESWARSWSNLSIKNVWASTFERENSGMSHILLEQDYGDAKDWKIHFEYLLPFFRDRRYIRIDGKPVILIYRTSDIVCLREMISLWREMATEAGLPGLYVIGGNCNSSMNSILDGQLYHEPQHSIRELRSICLLGGKLFQAEYEKVWEGILRANNEYEIQPYFEGFVGYDDTPRRGQEGVVILNDQPEIFERMLERLLWKNKDAGTSLVFLNAWNEWGEGMYLEPDKRYGYAWLEAVRNAKSRVLKNERVENTKQLSVPVEVYQGLQVLQRRTNTNLHLLEKWLIALEKGYSPGAYIKKAFPGDWAIYGYGIIGKRVYAEFRRNNIPIKYII